MNAFDELRLRILLVLGALTGFLFGFSSWVGIAQHTIEFDWIICVVFPAIGIVCFGILLKLDSPKKKHKKTTSKKNKKEKIHVTDNVQRPTGQYYNNVFPRITLLVFAVGIGFPEYLSLKENLSTGVPSDDKLYPGIIYSALISILLLVAAIFFNRIKINKTTTLRDLYDGTNDHNSCLAIFTIMLIRITFLVSVSYTMIAQAFQSPEYLFLITAFWIWGVLCCFVSNIHHFLQRKGLKKLSQFILEITFTKYQE